VTDATESEPFATQCRESNSEDSSLFADATDTGDFEISNSNSGRKLGPSNLNSDSIDSSEGSRFDGMAGGNSTDSESGAELSSSQKRISKVHSPPRADVKQLHLNLKDPSLEDVFEKTTDGREGQGDRETDPLRCTSLDDGEEGDREGRERAVSSFIKEILGRARIHPTTVGLWRLQRGEWLQEKILFLTHSVSPSAALQVWCTPSTFINFLILVS
jgi:hypothetical protein